MFRENNKIDLIEIVKNTGKHNECKKMILKNKILSYFLSKLEKNNYLIIIFIKNILLNKKIYKLDIQLDFIMNKKFPELSFLFVRRFIEKYVYYWTISFLIYSILRVLISIILNYADLILQRDNFFTRLFYIIWRLIYENFLIIKGLLTGLRLISRDYTYLISPLNAMESYWLTFSFGHSLIFLAFFISCYFIRLETIKKDNNFFNKNDSDFFARFGVFYKVPFLNKKVYINLEFIFRFNIFFIKIIFIYFLFLIFNQLSKDYLNQALLLNKIIPEFFVILVKTILKLQKLLLTKKVTLFFFQSYLGIMGIMFFLNIIFIANFIEFYTWEIKKSPEIRYCDLFSCHFLLKGYAWVVLIGIVFSVEMINNFTIYDLITPWLATFLWWHLALFAGENIPPY